MQEVDGEEQRLKLTTIFHLVDTQAIYTYRRFYDSKFVPFKWFSEEQHVREENAVDVYLGAHIP